MIKIIYFFVESTFNQRDKKRFGIEILKSRGFEVYVWDYTPFLYKKAFESFKPPDPIIYKNYELITDHSDFNKVSSKLNKSSVVVSLIGLKPETKFIFKYLNQNKIKFGFCNFGELPARPTSFPEKIISALSKPLLLKSRLYSLFQRKITSNIYPDFIIVGGEEGYNSNRYSKNSNTKLIKSHALDYDLYLNEESNRSDPIVRGNYVVFLDEFVPFHPDYFYRNIKPDCSFEDYYPDINRFFNKIESRFDVKVIIASHPRSNYKKNDNPFNERTCIINETINLVKFSKFVIAHASTATNFAVLYNKPILFITSNKYSTRYKKIIHFHSLVFGNKSINVSSRSINIDTEIKADKILYKNYKQQYIKMPKTPEKQIWEIFADNID